MPCKTKNQLPVEPVKVPFSKEIVDQLEPGRS